MTETLIVPLCLGTAVRPRSALVWGAPPEPVEFAFIGYYVRADGRHVLVDTGVPRQDEAAPRYQPISTTPGQHPIAALEAIGVGPEEIDVVVNTHLHWDHCANNHLFPNAKTLVQQAEVDYATAPWPVHRRAYDEVAHTGGEKMSLRGLPVADVSLLAGDWQISPHVVVLATPGHTPGSQSVLVKGQRNYLLAGDNLPLRANLPDHDVESFTPNAFYHDVDDYYRSIEVSLSQADVVLPSHDTSVLDHSRYS